MTESSEDEDMAKFMAATVTAEQVTTAAQQAAVAGAKRSGRRPPRSSAAAGQGSSSSRPREQEDSEPEGLDGVSLRVAAALDQVLARRCPFLSEAPPPAAASSPPPTPPHPAPADVEDTSDFRMFSWVPPATPCALTTPAAAALAASTAQPGSSSRPRKRPAGSGLLSPSKAPKPTQQQLAALAQGADATVARLATMQQQQQQVQRNGLAAGVPGVVLEGRPAVDPTTRAALLTGALPGSASLYTAPAAAVVSAG